MIDHHADISIVTSLYSSSRHLTSFLRRFEACARTVESQGFTVESIIVSNAPSRSESQLLRAALATEWWRQHCRLNVVPRETLYASWNRGVRASSGSTVTFWNVDDHRNPAAIVEAIQRTRGGDPVVRYPWVQVAIQNVGRPHGVERHVSFCDRITQADEDPEIDFCLGPFFTFRREVFDQHGAFDERFHIAGDYEWQLRVVPRTGLQWGDQLGGVFFSDGTNLCGSGNPRLLVEQNVIIERYGLERSRWPLDAHARALLATYDRDYAEGSIPERQWSFERGWRQRERWRGAYLMCRRAAGSAVRRARSWERRL